MLAPASRSLLDMSKVAYHVDGLDLSCSEGQSQAIYYFVLGANLTLELLILVLLVGHVSECYAFEWVDNVGMKFGRSAEYARQASCESGGVDGVDCGIIGTRRSERKCGDCQAALESQQRQKIEEDSVLDSASPQPTLPIHTLPPGHGVVTHIRERPAADL